MDRSVSLERLKVESFYKYATLVDLYIVKVVVADNVTEEDCKRFKKF